MTYGVAISIAAGIVILLLAGIWFVRRRRMQAYFSAERTRRIAEYKTWQWLFGRSRNRRLTYQPVKDDNAPKP